MGNISKNSSFISQAFFSQDNDDGTLGDKVYTVPPKRNVARAQLLAAEKLAKK